MPAGTTTVTVWASPRAIPRTLKSGLVLGKCGRGSSPLLLMLLLWANLEVSGFGETLGKFLKRELDNNKRKIFPMLRIRNITVQGVMILYSATMGGLQMEKINEGMNHLAEFGIMVIVITISLVILILSLKSGLAIVPNMKILLIKYKS